MVQFPYSFDRVAPLYDVTRAIPEEALGRIVSAVSRIAGDGRVLEVGVGTGRLAVPVQNAGLVVIGTDVGREMLRVARTKGLRNALLADAHSLPLVEHAVRVSLTARVLHLLRDWRLALREICRVTQESYLSVIERESAEPDLEAEYVRTAQTRGGNTTRPGLYEHDLARRLPPSQVIPIGTFSGTESAEHVIEMLNRRIFSSQWTIPEPVHQEVISGLTAQYSGATVAAKNEIELAVWKVPRLTEYLDGLSI